MEFLLVAGMIVCGWVFLCVLSDERERRGREIQIEAQLLQQEQGAAVTGQREKLTARERATKVR